VKLSGVLVECVINISEGRDKAVLPALEEAARPTLRDRHSDPDHHRSVFTLVGSADQVTASAQALARAAVASIDLGPHQGVHPRLGVLDVVPFVPYAPAGLPPSDLSDVIELRDQFAHWIATELGVPAFLYGPRPGEPGERTLPEVRRGAFERFGPDAGPPEPHPSAGACAVGARPVLIAYNVWVPSAAVAQALAPLVRRPEVRALGLEVAGRGQVSCNLIDPAAVGPAELYDEVDRLAQKHETGVRAQGAELVGLLPESILARVPPERWAQLGLGSDRTVESRL
jgi:glutamate formiminotransferase